MSISPDDPRLTEYSLGEMDSGTAKEFEATMAEDPATFDEVHEIKGTASTLGEAVSSRPLPRLTDTQRHRILRLAEAPAPQDLSAQPENVIRPAFWTWFGKFATGAAAAAIAVASLFFAYQRGYQNAVVDSQTDLPEKGTISKSEPRPGETPSIRLTVLDPEGEAQPVASRPISSDSVLPVSPGNEDALVSAVPKVHPGPSSANTSDPESEPDSESESPTVAEADPDGGTSPNPGLPIAAVDSPENPDGSTPASVMENPFVEVSSSPRSSFPLRAAADAYASAAGSIRGTGRLPDPATVAVEEIVNAFTYRVPGFVPKSSYQHPFAAGAEVFSCPWEPAHRLVRITVATPGSSAGEGEDPAIIAENIELLVEFNRTRAARYRLIGFDGAGLLSAVSAASPKSRALHAGDTITALYEVVPAEGANPLDDFRYTPHNFASPPRDHERELLCLSIAYTRPDVPEAADSYSDSLVVPVIDPGLAWNRSSSDFQWAAATAAFGMCLSGSEHLGEFGFDQIQVLAERALRNKKDQSPQRTAFIDLLRTASRISAQ